MKVVHISAIDYSGGGVAARRLNAGLQSAGVDSKMLVLDIHSFGSDIVAYTQHNTIIPRFLNSVRNRLIMADLRIYNGSRLSGYSFYDDRTAYTVSKHPLVKEADIIHLHWIAGFVDYGEFFKHTKNKPLVWTLHDRSPMTGGCHVPGDCKKYETECGKCPQLGSKKQKDLSYEIFHRKKEFYRKRSMNIVTPSKLLYDDTKKSALLKDFPTHIIPHGISTNTFSMRNKDFSRELLGLPKDKVLLLFGAAYASKNKGFTYLARAIDILKTKMDVSRIALVVFGPPQSEEKRPTISGVTVYPLGYIQDPLLLSCCYNAADIFVMPSLQEVFGLTCLESMACGVPVVGFNTGGLPEMIMSGKTGFVAEIENLQDLTKYIEWMIAHPAEREQMGKNARTLVEAKFSLEIQTKKYFDLYSSLLKTGS
jgi:glycosyltransferase involved in cell wall biosynthesis